jgi:nitroreductase
MTGPGSAPVLAAGVVEDAVSSAGWAPSILNSQPWRFRAAGTHIDVFTVPERAPSLLDTDGREVLLSVGAALLNLRLALGAAGYAVTIEPVPSQLDARLAATVRVVGSATLTPVEGGHLEAITGLHRKVVTGAISEADRTQRYDAELVDDSTLWTVERSGREGVGIPTELLGPAPSDPKALVRDFAFGRRVGDRPRADFEKSALLAALLTSRDERADWLRGGMALERVLLTATARGLSVGLLSQATEVPDLRRLVHDPMSAWRHPQIILRLGFGETPPPPPRLPLHEILETA